jgi:hypothetical protein
VSAIVVTHPELWSIETLQLKCAGGRLLQSHAIQVGDLRYDASNWGPIGQIGN